MKLSNKKNSSIIIILIGCIENVTVDIAVLHRVSNFHLTKFISIGTLGPGTVNEGSSRGPENQNAASAKQGIHCSVVHLSLVIDQLLLF